jgi:hypothetical protein
VFAAFETNLRRERQLAGIAAAKARGVYRGRTPSINPAEIQRLRTEEHLGASAIVRRLRIGRASGIGRWPTVGARRNVRPAAPLVPLRQRRQAQAGADGVGACPWQPDGCIGIHGETSRR